MAPRSRRAGSAELGHRIWDHMRGRAKSAPGEFPPDTRDDVEGWLWEGVVASLIREAIPGIADSDLRRAREYLNASGMVLNVRGHQRGGGQPQWFIRANWHQGPGGHVHVVTARRPGQLAAGKAGRPTAAGTGQPAGARAGLPDAADAGQAAAGSGQGEEEIQPRQDIMEALQSLVQQISELHSDNDRLRRDNDHLRRDNDLLRAEIRRIRALMREAGAAITRRVGELLADTGEHPH